MDELPVMIRKAHREKSTTPIKLHTMDKGFCRTLAALKCQVEDALRGLNNAERMELLSELSYWAWMESERLQYLEDWRDDENSEDDDEEVYRRTM